MFITYFFLQVVGMITRKDLARVRPAKVLQKAKRRFSNSPSNTQPRSAVTELLEDEDEANGDLLVNRISAQSPSHRLSLELPANAQGLVI
jgi:hypothetical protein